MQSISPTVRRLGRTVSASVGLYAPAKTPRQSVSQLSGWFTAALEVPEVKAKLVGLGLFPVGMCGADFSAFVRKKYEEYGHAIRELNIKVN